jgi:hypothetical protein
MSCDHQLRSSISRSSGGKPYLNTNKMIGQVSELHDDVSDTIFSITQDKLRFGNDLIFIYLYFSLSNGEY